MNVGERARWLLVVGALACSAPRYQDCTVQCTDLVGCPGGMSCLGGWCQFADTPACSRDAGGGDAGTCAPATEVEAACDLLDDDCDGVVDEGCEYFVGTPSWLTELHATHGTYGSPRLSHDGLRLYLMANGQPFVASRPSVGERFGAPATLPGAFTGYDIGSLTLSEDENEIIVSGRPAGTGDPSVLFRATRTDPGSAFSSFAVAHTPLPETSEGTPFLARGGLDLYFTAVPSTGGVPIIYRTRRASTTEPTFTQDVEIGIDPTPAMGAHSPFLSDDGLTLFFVEVEGMEATLPGPIFRASRPTPTDNAFSGATEVTPGGAPSGYPFVSEETGEVFFVADWPYSPAERAIWRARLCRNGPCPLYLAPSNCSPSWRRTPDDLHCYLEFPGEQSWDQAERTCRETFGGHLATIHSVAELSRALPTPADATPLWVGAQSPAAGVPFAWVTGEPFVVASGDIAFPTWAVSPAASGCVGLATDGYHVSDCTLSARYICELERWPWW